ncbi:hypothetical protein [Halomonas sp. G11]|uniref:hypothetical protein n=1 Tax=Halomonas sp. G11 TaxID=1684425 RepID=UPI0012E79C9E|nr:hypothetical protein [Halomonas sp. G11]
MFASIQSVQFYSFFCRVKKEPVIIQGNISVYELVDSALPNDIISKVNGKRSRIFRHVELDKDSIGYLYDFNNKKLDSRIGLCEYTPD